MEKQERFYSLPRWLQEDILRDEEGVYEYRKKRAETRIKSIEEKCRKRGYGLNPTRADNSFPPPRARRRPVGDYSIYEPDN